MFKRKKPAEVFQQAWTGVVSALPDEARCFAPTKLRPGSTYRLTGSARLSLCGIGDARAAHAAVEHLAEGADALVSWGIAGGLDPSLQPGSFLLPEYVVFGEARYATDPAWRERVATYLRPHFPVIEKPLLHSQTPITELALKQQAWESTGAVAVDMESGAVGRIALLNEVPFLCVRVIADPAWRTLPKSALAAMSAEGKFQPISLLGSLLIRPWEINELRALSKDMKAAQARLLSAWIWADEDLFSPPQCSTPEPSASLLQDTGDSTETDTR